MLLIADTSRLHELHYTVLSSYISLTPTAVPSSPVVQNGSVSAPYFLVFTGCELQESALKAWLTECAQQVSKMAAASAVLDHFKNSYVLLNLRALNISALYGIFNLSMYGSNIFCVEYHKYPLKLHRI